MTETTGFGAIRSIDYVIIPCDDVGRMQRFYSDLFGFRVEDEEPGHWVGYRVGTLFLGLRARGRAYDGPTPPEASAGVQLSFRVPPADVDLAYQTLVDKGIAVIEGPTDQDWPHRTLFFADPENNVIEIFADIHPRDCAVTSSGLHRIVG
ncbi:MAG: VOC family protein [Pseudomonadota bacterium]